MDCAVVWQHAATQPHNHKTVQLLSSVHCADLTPHFGLLPAVVHYTVVNTFQGTFNLKFIPPEQ